MLNRCASGVSVGNIATGSARRHRQLDKSSAMTQIPTPSSKWLGFELGFGIDTRFLLNHIPGSIAAVVCVIYSYRFAPASKGVARESPPQSSHARRALRALNSTVFVDVIRGFAQTRRAKLILPRSSRLRAARRGGGACGHHETVGFLAGNQLAVQAPHELPVILEGVTSRAGRSNPCSCWPGHFLSTVNTTVRRSAGRALVPHILAIVERAASSIRRSPASSGRSSPGEVVDDASPELRRIRESLRRQRTRLRGTLYPTCAARTRRNTAEQIVTAGMAGTCVVAGRTRGAIPGIVHGSSGSGASLYLGNREHRRDQQRHRGVGTAGAGRGPAHPAGPHRCVRGRADDLETHTWMLPPGSTS